MKQIQVEGKNYTVGPLTLRHILALQAAIACWERIGDAPIDMRKIGPAEVRTLADAVAAVIGAPVETVLDWPVAQTLSVAVVAGQAFIEVNGPYLSSHVAPAVTRLSEFAATLVATLRPTAVAPL